VSTVARRDDLAVLRPGRLQDWGVRSAQHTHTTTSADSSGPASSSRPASWIPCGCWTRRACRRRRTRPSSVACRCSRSRRGDSSRPRRARPMPGWVGPVWCCTTCRRCTSRRVGRGRRRHDLRGESEGHRGCRIVVHPRRPHPPRIPSWWPGGVASTPTNRSATGRCSPSPGRPGPAELADWLRGHWAIETLHDIRDTTYAEDASRLRTGNAPASRPLRNTAISLLRLTGIAALAAALRHNSRNHYRPLQLVGLT
jgi:hypothetical protein